MTHPLILEICRQHKVSPHKEFFGTARCGRVIKARIAAIIAFREKGMTKSMCARLIKRDERMVAYWLNAEFRERRREKMRLRNRAKKAVQKQVEASVT